MPVIEDAWRLRSTGVVHRGRERGRCGARPFPRQVYRRLYVGQEWPEGWERFPLYCMKCFPEARPAFVALEPIRPEMLPG